MFAAAQCSAIGLQRAEAFILFSHSQKRPSLRLFPFLPFLPACNRIVRSTRKSFFPYDTPLPRTSPTTSRLPLLFRGLLSHLFFFVALLQADASGFPGGATPWVASFVANASTLPLHLRGLPHPVAPFHGYSLVRSGLRGLAPDFFAPPCATLFSMCRLIFFPP